MKKVPKSLLRTDKFLKAIVRMHARELKKIGETRKCMCGACQLVRDGVMQ